MEHRSRAAVLALLAAGLVASCGSADAEVEPASEPSGSEPASGGEPSGGEPGCDQITRFADRITDVAAVYGYQPSSSPAELAEDNDVVLSGVLTGGFDEGSDDVGAFVAFGVEVSDVVVGESEEVGEGDEVFVSVHHVPSMTDADEFERAIAVGARAVVFANIPNEGRELVANLEGFMTACGDDEPMGMRGELGTWSSVESLDDVLSLATSDGA